MFRKGVERQALVARREMVRSRELLTRAEFCARLGVSERRIARMVATGSAFSIEVDGVEYFPALRANRERWPLARMAMLNAWPRDNRPTQTFGVSACHHA